MRWNVCFVCEYVFNIHYLFLIWSSISVLISVVWEHFYTVNESGSPIFRNFYTFDESKSRVFETKGSSLIEFPASA